MSGVIVVRESNDQGETYSVIAIDSETGAPLTREALLREAMARHLEIPNVCPDYVLANLIGKYDFYTKKGLMAASYADASGLDVEVDGKHVFGEGYAP